MAQITIYFRAYGWRSNGVRWQGYDGFMEQPPLIKSNSYIYT